MSYYLFHIIDEDKSKVYKFDTKKLCLIFEYIIKKWGKNYLKYIKYAQLDSDTSRQIPKSILKFVNDKKRMIDIIDQIDTQYILKLFHIRFCLSTNFQLSHPILQDEIFDMDYIYLQKLNIKDSHDVISLHCEYDLEDDCRCESLRFTDLPVYCNTTFFDYEAFDIIYKISDIENISVYPNNTDPDIKERIEFIEELYEFQEFLIGYECGHRLEFDFIIE